MKRFSPWRLAKRRWMVLLALFVVAMAGFSVYRLHGIFGSHNRISAPSVDSLDNPTFNPKRVLFEVFGSPGTVANINYLDEHAQPQHASPAPLPWSHQITTTDPTMFADLRAQGDSDFIGCRITVDGVIKDERSTHNVNGYISCLDKSA